MNTTTTTTGHTLTIDTARMLLEISGPTETMDGIPDAEIHAACAEAGVVWNGEVVDETTYAVSPLPVRVKVIRKETAGPEVNCEGAREVFLTVTVGEAVAELVGHRADVVREIAAMAEDGRVRTQAIAEAVEVTRQVIARAVEVTRYTQDGTAYICAGNDSTDTHAARSAAEVALRDGEALADGMTRVDGCCTWEVRS